MSQRRAQKGGEVGANGEWYPGGKWIATTTRAKSYRPIRPTGRQLIEPGVWAEPPTATSVALLGQLGVGAWTVLVNGQARVNVGVRFHSGEPVTGDSLLQPGIRGVLGVARFRLQDLVDRYNTGERWLTVTLP